MISKKLNFILLLIAMALIGCESTREPTETNGLIQLAATYERIQGSKEYLSSPYVTAGDRLYMVGHQDGSFPDLGWHIDGEMGGIWNHPIKLMDGFSMMIMENERFWVLDSATAFYNYPFGNLHEFEYPGLNVKRFQYVPEGLEGLIMEIAVENTSSDTKTFEFVFTGHVDLRPTWLAERKNIQDVADEGRFEEQHNAFIAYDKENPWFVAFAGNGGFAPTGKGISQNRKGLGTDLTLSRKFSIPPGDKTTFQFYISGSNESEAKTFQTLKALQTNSSALLREKITKFEGLDAMSRLTTNDPGLDQMFRWIKYNTQWLVRDVPEVGRGISAGIPDYPWWFGTDAAYIIQGLVSAGLHEEAMNTIDLIMKISRNENGNGKIVHEVSSNGIVFNPGNLNTTPTFIHALWKAYEWTGEQRIIDDYYPDILQGIEWIERMDQDGNGYPDGAGMMEIHGLDSEMMDVVSYLYLAYVAAKNFAEVKGDEALASRFSNQAKTLQEKINRDWWVEEASSFADFRSSHEKFMEALLATKARMDTLDGLSPEVRQDMKNEVDIRMQQFSNFENSEEVKPYVIHHNWVVNTPMEVGAASPEHAMTAFETARDYTSRFGVYVTGVDKKEEQEEATKWKAFSYVSAVMTLPTGVQAIGEAKYGNVNNALAYLKMLQNSFSYALPGAMYEVSPDFGMMAQGWNIYAVAVPIVDHFFGIHPSAYDQSIVIAPQMPADWEEAKLENVRVGNNELSISFTREGGVENYTIEQKLDWDIQFKGKDNQTGIIK